MTPSSTPVFFAILIDTQCQHIERHGAAGVTQSIGFIVSLCRHHVESSQSGFGIVRIVDYMVAVEKAWCVEIGARCSGPPPMMCLAL